VRALRGVQVIPILYDPILWSSGWIGAFPRVHRFTVGDRMMSAQLDILGNLITAHYGPGGAQAGAAPGQSDTGAAEVPLTAGSGPAGPGHQGLRAGCRGHRPSNITWVQNYAIKAGLSIGLGQ